MFLPFKPRDEDESDTDRRDDAAHPQPGRVEREVVLSEVRDFVLSALRPDPADKEGCQHPSYRHDRVVGDKVHRVKEVFAADLREVAADGEGGGHAEQRDGYSHDDRRLCA